MTDDAPQLRAISEARRALDGANDASTSARLALGRAMLNAYNAGVGDAPTYARIAGLANRQAAWDLMRRASVASGVKIRRRRNTPQNHKH